MASFKDFMNENNIISEGMYDGKFTGQNLGSWSKQSLMDRLGFVYVQDRESDYQHYFHPVEMQKNGGIKGVGFGVSDGRIVGKAKQMSVSRMNLGWYKQLDYRHVPKKIIDKIGEKMKTMTESDEYEDIILENNVQIANEIKRQLGNMTLMMLGAKNLVAVDRGIRFRIRGSSKVNLIKITLTGMDLYDVEYGKVHGTKYKVVATDKGIYNDMLHNSIEKHTGLYTKM